MKAERDEPADESAMEDIRESERCHGTVVALDPER